MSACTEYAMYKYDVHATIHGAIKDGNIEDLRQLLQDDDHFITYAFLKAIESMQVDMIRFLLEGYDVDVNQYNGAALIDSARCGNLEVVDLLLAHDADVTIGENGALEVAVENAALLEVDLVPVLGQFERRADPHDASANEGYAHGQDRCIGGCDLKEGFVLNLTGFADACPWFAALRRADPGSHVGKT